MLEHTRLCYDNSFTNLLPHGFRVTHVTLGHSNYLKCTTTKYMVNQFQLNNMSLERKKVDNKQ